MDPDQELLKKLDRKEDASAATITATIVGISCAAGLVGYFTLIQNATSELAIDGGALIAIVAAVGLLIAYRTFR